MDTTLDSSRLWVDSFRINEMVKPSLLVRTATDSNYQSDQYVALAAYGNARVQAKAIMNSVSPGMRIPGIMTWQVDEAIDTLTSTGSMQLINALPVSKNTRTTLTNSLPARWFNPTIKSQVVSDSVGKFQTLVGNRRVSSFIDPSNKSNTSNPMFREERLLYRVFQEEVISVQNIAGFPDPGVPLEEMKEELGGANSPDINKGTYWRGSSTGVGAYFLLINQEVVRVTDWNPGASTFTIPPGGRAVNGVLQNHSPGESVILLGFTRPFTGESAALNYLIIDDFTPYTCLLRPGTALVAYEGYGDFSAPMSKTPNLFQNYAFAGYWFTGRSQASETDDGRPLIVFDLLGAGYPVTSQKISQELLFSSKTQYGSWADAAFDAAGIGRKIPGNQYDYHNWDPTLPAAYPLHIQTELSQNKSFFDHMGESQNGVSCEICQAEFADAIRRGVAPNSIQAARTVGQHIYKESIRVFNKCTQWGGGPIKTYLRLMMQLAIGAWENNIDRTPLAQRWTKMPTQLFNNLTNFQNGMVWNGQLSFTLPGVSNPEKTITFDNQTRDDKKIVGNRVPLTCPFDSQYDNQEFTVPMQDLADVNGMTFYIKRNGQPCFIPTGMKLRGINSANPFTTGEWFMNQGYSISSYNHDVDPSTIVTNGIVTATTAFDTDISIACGGTGYDLTTNEIIWYSGKVGNKLGLELTGGVMHFDTLSLDHLVLGFDWYTDGTMFGLPMLRDGSIVQFYRFPSLPDGSPVLKRNDNYTKGHKNDVKNIQNFIAFLVIRRYIQALENANPNATQDNFGLVPNGDYDSNTEQYVKAIQSWLKAQMSSLTSYAGEDTKKPLHATGEWDTATYYWVIRWKTVNANFIKTDVWWWAINGLDWDQYVMHILGIPVPQIKSNTDQTGEAQWSIDQTALKVEQGQAAQKFATMMYNAGNRIVDESINKATVRSLTSNIADPRIEVGDVIWAEVPGHLTSVNAFGVRKPPMTNGIYVTNISRAIDLEQGSYVATYSGYRYRGDFNDNLLKRLDSYYVDNAT